MDSSGVDSDVVYKFSTKFSFTNDVMFYGLYSQGFRLGGTNSQRAASTGLIPLVYEPDTVDNYELGLKSILANGHVLLNVTAFNMVWDQIQVNQNRVDGLWWLRGTINGGEAESKGIEIQTSWQVSNNLYLEGYAFLADPEFTQEIVGAGNFIVPAGAPMVWSPDRKYKFALEYTVPDVWGGDLWFRYDYSYEGEKWARLQDIVEQNFDGLAPSWNLSNFHVGLTLDNGWETQLTVQNLFSQKALNGLWNGYYGTPFDDPRYSGVRSYARPRTVGISVRKSFEWTG